MGLRVARKTTEGRKRRHLSAESTTYSAYTSECLFIRFHFFQGQGILLSRQPPAYMRSKTLPLSSILLRTKKLCNVQQLSHRLTERKIQGGFRPDIKNILRIILTRTLPATRSLFAKQNLEVSSEDTFARFVGELSLRLSVVDAVSGRDTYRLTRSTREFSLPLRYRER